MGFSARQRANQLGRALESRGLVVRRSGACTSCGDVKIVTTPGHNASRPPAAVRGAPPVADGHAALSAVLAGAGYPSLVAAVAAHTVFLHPATVAQTRGEPLFPIVRAPLTTPRGRTVEIDGRTVWADDNTPPTDAFLVSTQGTVLVSRRSPCDRISRRASTSA